MKGYELYFAARYASFKSDFCILKINNCSKKKLIIAENIVHTAEVQTTAIDPHLIIPSLSAQMVLKATARYIPPGAVVADRYIQIFTSR